LLFFFDVIFIAINVKLSKNLALSFYEC